MTSTGVHEARKPNLELNSAVLRWTARPIPNWNIQMLTWQITVQIGGKLVRLREDSFSILIKQDAWEIIQYCGTRVRILSGSNCFFVVLLCHTAHYYRSKSHKIFISNYADQANKKVSLRMHEYNICCKSCSKSVYFSRTKEVLLTMLWQNLNTLFWSLYLISML